MQPGCACAADNAAEAGPSTPKLLRDSKGRFTHTLIPVVSPDRAFSWKFAAQQSYRYMLRSMRRAFRDNILSPLWDEAHEAHVHGLSHQWQRRVVGMLDKVAGVLSTATQTPPMATDEPSTSAGPTYTGEKDSKPDPHTHEVFLKTPDVGVTSDFQRLPKRSICKGATPRRRRLQAIAKRLGGESRTELLQLAAQAEAVVLNSPCLVYSVAQVQDNPHMSGKKDAYLLLQLGGGHTELAHRLVLWATKGRWPRRYGNGRRERGKTSDKIIVAMHICHNKMCLNPNHLCWGTLKENAHRSGTQKLVPLARENEWLTSESSEDE